MRRIVVFITLALCLAPTASPSGTPNVLLVTFDGLRAGRIGCYGYENASTPALDAIAEQGARFENAVAVAPWTNPSIVSLLTGLYPCRHGVDRRGAVLAEEAVTLADAFRGAGYHVPAVSYLLKGPEYRDAGFALQPEPDWRGRTVEDFERALREFAPEPFFIWLHHKGTHLPYDPPVELLARFRSDPLPDTPPVRAVRTQQVIDAGAFSFSDEDKEAVRDLYDAQAAAADRDLSRLLAVLRERGVLDRTIVAVTADHGEELFDHGLLGHASTTGRASLYGEVLHVPLLLRYPAKVRAGVVVNGTPSQVDVMPTLLDLAGLDVPEGIDGRSLAGAMRTGRGPRRAVFAETRGAGYRSAGDASDPWLNAVREGRWKLLHETGLDRERWSLYDLKTDPGETRNLAPRSDFRLGRLKTLLARWRARCEGQKAPCADCPR